MQKETQAHADERVTQQTVSFVEFVLHGGKAIHLGWPVEVILVEPEVGNLADAGAVQIVFKVLDEHQYLIANSVLS